MKFVHLADLHIGKRVNGFSMIEDQKYILSQIADIIKSENPDAIIIAGDVYDKSVPTAEAVCLLDSFFTSLCSLCTHIFVISGNHDSSERLAFCSGALKNSGLYISPVFDGKVMSVDMTDEFGTVAVHLLPFVKPSVVCARYMRLKIRSPTPRLSARLCLAWKLMRQSEMCLLHTSLSQALRAVNPRK